MKTNNAIQHTLPPALRYRQMAMVLAALFIACFSLLTPATAQTITSAVPGFISYQGKVLNSSGGLVGAGTPVNRTVIFRIWGDASNTIVGNLLYSEQQTVTISEGEFSVLIGQGVATAGTPLGYSETTKGPGTVSLGSLSVFANSTRYLGVTVDDGTAAADNEITPRQQIVSSAYAFRAKYAESLGSNGATSLTALDSGNVGIGNTNPPSLFTITGANTTTTTNTPQLVITDTLDQNERLLFGVDSTGNSTGFIQATKVGTGAQNLLLNPNGGNVGIGNASPTAKLDVTGGIKATGAGGYTFNTGDLDGGLFSPADGVLTLLTNNTERVRVDASGNVGIGTNTPGARLSLGSTLANSKFMLYDDGTSFYGLGVQANQFRLHTATSSDRFSFLNAPNGTENMTILGNGNVGIGTASPRSILEIAPATATTDGIRIGKWADTASRFIGITDQPAGFTFPTTGGFSGIEFGGPASTAEGFLAFHTHDSGVSSGERMRIDKSGNVGIGTATPDARLTIAGVPNNANGLKLLGSSTFCGMTLQTTSGTNGHYTMTVRGDTGNLEFRNEGTVLYPLVMTSSGSVGIGTPPTTTAKLTVGSVSTGSGTFGNGRYINLGGETTAVWGGGNVSIYAAGNIVSNGIHLYSDERIKKVIGQSDRLADLQTLLSIQITDYRYKDEIAQGSGVQKKVIAQQVEKVFPQAVSQGTDVVPDIFRKASIEDGWVMLTTDLKMGERVRLMTAKEEGIHDVLEVKKDRFRTAFKPSGKEVFVYGREVNDFRRVDYDAISMLNVSATQQIKKEKDVEVKALQDENADLKDKLAAQDKRLAEIEAKDKARDAKLAAIEKALESVGKAAVRTASLKKAE